MNDIAVQRASALGEPPAAAGEGIYLLLEAARKLQGRLETALQEVGLSGAKYLALEHLVRSGEPLTLGELAGCLNCVRSNITQLVDRLEADGLVQRADDPGDRRAVRARVTPLGIERYAAGARAIRGVEAELADRVAPEDRAILHRVLAAFC